MPETKRRCQNSPSLGVCFVSKIVRFFCFDGTTEKPFPTGLGSGGFHGGPGAAPAKELKTSGR